MHDVNTLPEEAKLLIRDMRQAAKTALDVGAGRRYAMAEFYLALTKEALARTNSNRTRAAKLLGEHRNTITRALPTVERMARERYESKPQRVVTIRPRLLRFG